MPCGKVDNNMPESEGLLVHVVRTLAPAI